MSDFGYQGTKLAVLSRNCNAHIQSRCSSYSLRFMVAVCAQLDPAWWMFLQHHPSCFRRARRAGYLLPDSKSKHVVQKMWNFAEAVFPSNHLRKAHPAAGLQFHALCYNFNLLFFSTGFAHTHIFAASSWGRNWFIIHLLKWKSETV